MFPDAANAISKMKGMLAESGVLSNPSVPIRTNQSMREDIISPRLHRNERDNPDLKPSDEKSLISNVSENPPNIDSLPDIPSWLRSMRMQKYTDCLKDVKWSELLYFDDEDLEKHGVNALGARRKLIRVCGTPSSRLRQPARC
jgi:hypothetical protein